MPRADQLPTPGQSQANLQSGGRGQASQPGQYMDFYDRLRQQNTRFQNGYRGQDTKFNTGQQDQRSEEQDVPQRELNGVERFFTGIGSAAEDLMSRTGKDVTATNAVELIQRPNEWLPFIGQQMVSTVAAPFTAPQGLYEAATGRAITEADENGMYTGKDLTMEQRAGAGIGSGIDALGSMFGGSARFLGAVGKGAGKAVAKMSGERVGKGIERVGDHMANSGWIQRATGSRVGQFGVDVAEEAGEEFVQSYAEDARNQELGENSLKKALDAASLGAVGGGVMSGMGHGMNYALDRFTQSPLQQNNDSFSSTKQSADPAFSPFSTKLGADGGKLNQVAAAQMAEDQKDHREVPGSSSGKLVANNDDLMFDDSEMGANIIYSIAQANDDGQSRQVLMETFDLTEDEASSIFDRGPYNDQVENDLINMLNAKIAAKETGIKWTLGTMPGLAGNPVGDLDLKRIVRGKAINVHASVLEQAKRDCDGDIGNVFFGSRHPGEGRYFSEMLYDFATGERIDDVHRYGNFMRPPSSRNSEASHRLRDAIDNALGTVFPGFNVTTTDANGNVIGIRQTALSGAINAYRNAFRDGGNIGDFFDVIIRDVRNEVRRQYLQRNNVADVSNLTPEQNAEMRQEMATRARSVVNIMSRSLKQSSILSTQFESSVRYADQQTELSHAELADIDNTVSDYSPGEMPISKSLSKALGVFNYLIDDMDYGVAAFWRQSQLFHFMNKSENYVSDGVAPSDITPAFNKLVSWVMHLQDISETPKRMIDGLYKVVIVREMKGKYPHGIDKKTDLNQYFRDFVEIRNRWANHYNEAIKVKTTEGQRLQLGVTDKKMLEFEESDNGNYHMSIVQEFAEVYGESNIEEIINLKENDFLYGVTLENAIDYARSKGNGYRAHISAMPKFNPVFSQMVKFANNRLMAAEKTVMQTFDESGLYVDIDYDENGNVNPKDIAVFNQWHAAVTRLMDVGVMIRENLASDTFLASPYGRAMLKGGKEAYSAVMGVHVHDQFSWYAIRLRNALDTGNDVERDSVLAEVSRLADVSPLHKVIVADFMAGKTEVYESLVELGSYDNKIDMLERTVTYKGTEPWLIHAMTTQDSTIEVGDITARARSAKSMVSKSEISMIEALQKEKEDLVGVIKSAGDKAVRGIADYLQNPEIEQDMDVVHTMYADAENISSKDGEKNTATLASVLYANGVGLENYGSLRGFMETAFGSNFRSFDVKDINSNPMPLLRFMFGVDGNEFIKIKDGGRGAKVYSREECWNILTDGQLGYTLRDNDGNPSPEAVITLLNNYPNLVTHIGPKQVQTIMGKDPTVRLVQKNGVSAASAIQEYVTSGAQGTGTKSGTSKVNERRIKSIIKNRIFAEADHVLIITGMLENIGQYTYDKQGKNAAVDAAYKKLVDMIYWGVSHPECSQELDDYYSRFQDSSLARICEDVDRLINSTNAQDAINQACSMSNDQLDFIANQNAQNTHYEILNELLGNDAGVLSNINDTEEILTRDIEAIRANTLEMGIRRARIEFLMELGRSDLGSTADMVARHAAAQRSRAEHFANDVMNMDEAEFKGMFETSNRNFTSMIQDPVLRQRYETNAALSEAELNMVKAMIVTEYLDRLDSNPSMFRTVAEQFPGVVSLSEILNMSIDDATDAIRTMCHSFGVDEVFDEETTRSLLGSHPGEPDAHVLDVTRHYRHLLSCALESETSSINTYMSSFNGNALATTLRAHESLRAIIDRCREDVTASGRSVPQTDKPSFIKFHFTDPEVAAQANTNHMRVRSGFNTYTTGVNGSYAYNMMPIAWLDSKMSCGHPPREVTIGEIIENPDMFGGYIDPDTNEMRRISQGVLRSWSQEPDDSRAVLAYHTDDCTCGCCCNHSRIPDNVHDNRYMFVRTIQQFITAVTVENHSIQAKKRNRFLMPTYYVLPGSDNEITNMTLDFGIYDANRDRNAAHDTFQQNFFDLRDEMRRYVKRVMDNAEMELNDNGIAMLSAFMTPGAAISFSDGSSMIVTAAQLMGNDPGYLPEAFVNGEVSITSCSALVMSPEDIADHIFEYVLERVRGIDSEDDITMAMISDWAGESLLNFDNYNSNHEYLYDAVSGIGNRGHSFKAVVPLDATPTEFQKFSESMLAGHDPTRSFETKIISEPITKDWKNACDNFTEQIFPDLKKQGFTVVGSIFGKDEDNPNFKANMGGASISAASIRLREDNNAVATGSGNDVILYMSNKPEGLKMAKGRARELGCSLLVPSSLVEASDNVVEHYDISGDLANNTIDFAMLDVSSRELLDRFSDDLAVSNYAPVRLSSIAIGMGVTDIFTLGNSDTAIFSHFASRQRIDEQKSQTLSIKSLFKEKDKNARYTLLADDPCIDLNENVDLSFYVSEGGKSASENHVRQCVQEYLNRRNSYISENGKVLTTTEGGGMSCLGFVSTTRHGRTIYAPILLPESAPNSITSARVEMQGGKLDTLFSYSLDISDGATIKIALEGMPYKSIGMIIDRTAPTVCLVPGDAESRVNVSIDLGYDQFANDSRLAGMTKRILLKNLFWMSRKIATSIFQEKVRNPETGEVTWQLRPEFAGQDGEPDRFIVDAMNGVTGAGSFWDQVARGEINFLRRENMSQDDAVVNAAIRKVALRCLRGKGHKQIPVLAALESLSYKKGNVHDPYEVNYNYIFGDLSYHEILALYNYIDPTFCPSSFNSAEWNPGDTIFDQNGNILCYETTTDHPHLQQAESKPRYRSCSIGPLQLMGENSESKSTSHSATLSMQSVIINMLRTGPKARFTSDVMSYIYARDRDADAASTAAMQRAIDRRRREFDEYGEYDLSDMRTITQMIDEARSYKCADEYMRDLKIVAGDNKDRVNPYDDKSPEGRLVQKAVDKLNNALGGKDNNKVSDLTFREAGIIARHIDGRTEENGKGHPEMSLEKFIRACDIAAANVERYGTPVVRTGDNNIDGKNGMGKGRIPIQMFPRDFNERLMTFPTVRQHFDSVEDLAQNQLEMLQHSLDLVSRLKDKVGKRAFQEWTRFLLRSNEFEARTESFVRFKEWAQSFENAGEFISVASHYTRAEREEIMRIANISMRTEEARRQRAERYLKSINTNYVVDSSQVLQQSAYRGDNKLNKFTQTIINLEKAIPILGSPVIRYSNVITRGTGAFSTRLWMHIGQSVSGLTGTINDDYMPSQEAIAAMSSSDDAQTMWEAIRQGLLTNDDVMMRNVCNNIDDAKNFLESRKTKLKDARKRGGIEGFTNQLAYNAFQFASGGRAFTNLQIQNALNQFCIICQEKGIVGPLFARDENGTTMFNRMLLSDSSADIFIHTLKNDMYRNAMLSAINFANRSDIAQRNIVSSLYTSIAKRWPIVDLFTSTTLTPYVGYATNLTGKVLNAVIPMSTLHYVVVDMAKQYAAAHNLDSSSPNLLGQMFDEMNLESMESFSSFKQVLMLDAARLSFTALGLIIAFGLTGALQPPEDEDKMCNYFEWTLFGMRVRENWWMADILGPAIPYACFLTSCVNGQPRLDVLVNGFAQVAATNPMLKIGDMLACIADPLYEIGDDYSQDVEKYGEQGFGEWLSNNGTTMGATWLANLVTPSIVTDVYRSYFAGQYEKSYKKIWETDENGNLTGREIQNENPVDMQIRKAVRYNPIIGILLDIANPSSHTSYLSGGTWKAAPPEVTYYDQAQLWSMKNYSIYNEDGSDKTDEEKQAIAYEIISILCSYSDMDELKEQGFALEYDTMDYVGDVIWDIYNATKESWNTAEANGEHDYYELGETFEEGREVFASMKQSYYDRLQFWYNLYNDKLQSEALRSGMVQYHRYITSYAQDNNGDWYATGYKYNTISPFLFAPGRLDNPEGTMGYEGDWQTPSAVIPGESTGQRALVPEEVKYDYAPFESHASEENGGYSKNYNGNTYGNYGNKNNNGNDNKYPSYGSRGGGGGGGGGNIYSRLPNVYMPSARTMNVDRMYNAQFDYLRPNFETKGSREAYKRGDF